jgi:hypothetical protein
MDDPKYVNAPQGDFHLTQGSPCINTGDPNSGQDPDGTRKDMGALFYVPPNVVDGREIMNEPASYELQQNYPNPFNPSTTIAFDLPKASEVELTIYDLRGHLVRVLLQQWRPAGHYKVEWDGKGNSALPVSSGVYIVRLQASTFEKTIKVILVK